jgi:hypothetical protein
MAWVIKTHRMAWLSMISGRFCAQANASELPGVPTTFMTGCSILKSWSNVETWMDDRLRPCKHISSVSQSHTFIAGISTRVGKQQQRNPTSFLGSNFLFLQINYINRNVSVKNITSLAKW